MPQVQPLMNDGFSTRIVLGTSTFTLWEKEVTWPEVSLGGPIETTTMRAVDYRTRAPKKLRTLGELKLTVGYDPADWTNINAALGIIQSIGVLFPDGKTFNFYGWLESFKPNRMAEGVQPTAEITIFPSNTDATGNYNAQQVPRIN